MSAIDDFLAAVAFTVPNRAFCAGLGLLGVPVTGHASRSYKNKSDRAESSS